MLDIRGSTTIKTDVLVVGGGGAACRAAVAAFDAGAATAIVLKGSFSSCGATVAPGRNAAWQVADSCAGTDDNPELHLENILDTGLGMANPDLAQILVYETLDRTSEMEGWGLDFIPDPLGQKRHYAGYSCFGNRPRAHGIINSGWGHAGDIVKVLAQQIKLRAIQIFENIYISDLILKDGICIGAVGISEEGELIVFQAGAVVVAAGGARQLFPQESGAARIDTTGDGYAFTARAGAELANMEFTQYMLHPVGEFGVKAPGSVWSLHPILRNNQGEDILEKHLPPGIDPACALDQRTLHYPFSSRDDSKWVDIAITQEVRNGLGTDEGGIYLDFSTVDLTDFTPSRPQHIPPPTDRSVTLPDEFLQIKSTAHAVNGGIWIDQFGSTSLSGLFAAGEVASGPHGADRLGGGMLPSCQVFGERAGRYAAEFALQGGRQELIGSDLEVKLSRLNLFSEGDWEVEKLLKELQQAAGTCLMIVRNEESLNSLLEAIKGLQEEKLTSVNVDSTRSLLRALELENSLLTAEMMARAALLRKESRGSHFRDDYPVQDDIKWEKNIFVTLKDGTLSLRTG